MELKPIKIKDPNKNQNIFEKLRSGEITKGVLVIYGTIAGILLAVVIKIVMGLLK